MAGGSEGEELVSPTQDVVKAVAAYKAAAASVKSLVPKPKAKAKALPKAAEATD